MVSRVCPILCPLCALVQRSFCARSRLAIGAEIVYVEAAKGLIS